MVVVEISVKHASQADFDLFDIDVSGAIEELGGPPEGLMAHVVRPDGDGFVICDVWKSPEDFHRFNDDIVAPRLAAAGLKVADERVSPVWSFARP